MDPRARSTNARSGVGRVRGCATRKGLNTACAYHHVQSKPGGAPRYSEAFRRELTGRRGEPCQRPDRAIDAPSVNDNARRQECCLMGSDAERDPLPHGQFAGRYGARDGRSPHRRERRGSERNSAPPEPAAPPASGARGGPAEAGANPIGTPAGTAAIARRDRAPGPIRRTAAALTTPVPERAPHSLIKESTRCTAAAKPS